MVELHGTDDDHIPYEGGHITRNYPYNGYTPDVDEWLGRWSLWNNCTSVKHVDEDSGTVHRTLSTCGDLKGFTGGYKIDG